MTKTMEKRISRLEAASHSGKPIEIWLTTVGSDENRKPVQLPITGWRLGLSDGLVVTRLPGESQEALRARVRENLTGKGPHVISQITS